MEPIAERLVLPCTGPEIEQLEKILKINKVDHHDCREIAKFLLDQAGIKVDESPA